MLWSFCFDCFFSLNGCNNAALFCIYSAGLSDVFISLFPPHTNFCVFALNNAACRQPFSSRKLRGRDCRVPVRHNCRIVLRGLIPHRKDFTLELVTACFKHWRHFSVFGDQFISNILQSQHYLETVQNSWEQRSE